MQTIIAPTEIIHATELPFNQKGLYSAVTENEFEIESKLDSIRRNLIERTYGKIPVSSKQVTGFIENEIIKMCDYVNPLAVVMATHGTTLKEKFFVRSITVYLSKSLTYPKNSKSCQRVYQN